jgi:hypothetical protein
MKKTLAIGIGIAIIAIVIGVMAYASNVSELKIEGPTTDAVPKGKNYTVTLTETLGAADKGP